MLLKQIETTKTDGLTFHYWSLVSRGMPKQFHIAASSINFIDNSTISRQTWFSPLHHSPCEYFVQVGFGVIQNKSAILKLLFSFVFFFLYARTLDSSHLIYLVIQNDHNATSIVFIFSSPVHGWDMHRGTAYWHEFNPFAGSNNQHFWSAWLHVDVPFFCATTKKKTQATLHLDCWITQPLVPQNIFERS